MCRYAMHTYKSHFACFGCRKAFKKTAFGDYVKHGGLEYALSQASRTSAPHMQKGPAEAGPGTYDQIEERYLQEVSTCPDCGQAMAAMGLDFRAPRQRDAQAWRIIAALHEHGFAFTGCGCSGVGYTPPDKLSALPAWLEQHARKSAGQQLLDAIRAKSA